MQAENESAYPAEHCNRNLSRRRALHGAAAVGALAAGAAVAATSGHVDQKSDPGLAALEAGYRRWQAIRAEADAPGERRDALYEGAELRYFADRTRNLYADPDHIAAEQLLAEQRALWDQGDELRAELLAIATTSARGVLIKLALAVNAETLDGIEAACGQCDFNAEDLLPAIVADVRAMAGGAA